MCRLRAVHNLTKIVVVKPIGVCLPLGPPDFTAAGLYVVQRCVRARATTVLEGVQCRAWSGAMPLLWDVP
jgi:hypothetical protein